MRNLTRYNSQLDMLKFVAYHIRLTRCSYVVNTFSIPGLGLSFME